MALKKKHRRQTPSATIPNVVQPESKLLNFSFKHLDCNSEKFALRDCDAEFWEFLARTLQRYSQQPTSDFQDQENHEHRHQITFETSTELEGFSHLDMDQVAYLERWQFEVGPHQLGRVHGFLVDDMFYIVWLDPLHRLHLIHPRPANESID